MKKILYTMLLLIAVSLTAGAQTQFWYHGVHYEVTDYGENAVMVISSDNYGYSGPLVIPKRVKTTVDYYGEETDRYFDVVAVGEGAFNGCSGLTSIELPSTIQTIGDYAFKNCTGLSDIVLPNSVVSIGEGAFQGCTGLMGFTLSKRLKTISKDAFNCCTGLTSLTIPSRVNSIGTSAFQGCTGLTRVVMPNSVNNLGDNVFYGCTALTSVQLSRNAGRLSGTFAGCTSLASISLPLGVVSLDGTFTGCVNLTSVELPNTLVEIGQRAFDGCSSLTSLYLPNSVEQIEDMAFRNTGLTSIELPGEFRRFGQDAFYGCKSLTSITSRRTSPPYMSNEGCFDSEIYNFATLIVPSASVDDYKSADWWRMFENVEGGEFRFEEGGICYLITGPTTVEVTYKVKQWAAGYQGSVAIPATVTHNGMTYQVMGIGDCAFSGCPALTQVSLPEGLRFIGDYAFSHTGLTGVVIPSTVKRIGDSAFSYSQITSVTIPEAVEVMDAFAFSGSPLTSLTWNARECWTGEFSGLTELVIGNEVTVLPPRLAYFSQITTLEIPSSVKVIGVEAFCSCQGLTSLTIPEGVTSIGDNAFADCSGLTSLTWNARECWDYGNISSENSNSISQINIGGNVEVLPSDFAKYTDITSVTLPSSIHWIGDSAFFACCRLESDVVIGDQVTDIGRYAFVGCSQVKGLTIGKNVEHIGTAAFGSEYTDSYYNYYSAMAVSSLTWKARCCESTGNLQYYYVNELTLGDEVEVIPYGFCQNADRITEVQFPASLKTIGGDAFKNCDKLGSLQLPNSVTEIGPNAFYGCLSVVDLSLPSSLATINKGAFSYCSSIQDLFIPASVTAIGPNAFKSCYGLSSIVVDNNNPVYDSRNNCNAVIKTANDSLVLVCKNTTIPPSFTEIPDSAFFGQSGMTSFVIPNSVTRIGKDAFHGTGLTSITIPASVTTIGENAFMYCSNLESMVVENGNPVYDSRDNCNAINETSTNTMLYGCKNTVIPGSIKAIGDFAFYNNRQLTGMTIPDGVERIGRYSFGRCYNLKSVSISNTVETIGYNAFSYCDGLTDLSFGNSVKEIGESAFASCSKLTSVSIPDSVKTIGYAAFRYCYGLQTVEIGKSVDTIGGYAFQNCENLINLNMGNSVKVIMANAFQYCSKLSRVTIPASTVSVGANAFEYCYSLESLVLGDNIKVIGDYAFNCCRKLQRVTIPNSVEQIRQYAFSYCRKMESVTLGKSVTRLGRDAFYYSDSLRNVVCMAPAPPTCDNNSTFSPRYNTAKLTVLESSVEAYKAAYSWKQFATIEGMPGCGLGDVDGDGTLDVNDVTVIINMVLNSSADLPLSADVDGDGIVDVNDVTRLIDMILRNP